MKRLKPTTILEYVLLILLAGLFFISYDLDGGFSNEARSRCV